MMLFLRLALGVTLLRTVSGRCTLCFQDAAPTAAPTPECDTLADAAANISSLTSGECIDLQTDAFLNCGCPPVAMPNQDSCELCGPGVMLPFPNRTVYIEGAEPTTCEALQESSSESRQLCDDAILEYQFYCGCPGVKPDCPLCPQGGVTPVADLILKGYAPTWFPDPVAYTCGELERQRSLSDATACTSSQEAVEDLAQLCGCFIPEEMVNCTTICPDGTLIDPAFWENEALNEQPGFGTMTCQEYEFTAASGRFSGFDCDNANYVGIKRCGCLSTKPFCDICEDGMPLETLEQEVTFGRTCLNYAGDAYFFDPQDEICVAFQSTAGIYCGCNNPIASQDACRICDERGGNVVNDSNLTIPVGQFVADCGELEFTGNDVGNPQGYTCQDMIDFGVQCCEFAPSTTPTASPAPTVTPAPTITALPTREGATGVPTSLSSPGTATGAPTAGSNPGVGPATAAPTAGSTMASTPDSTMASTPASTSASTPASTPESTPAATNDAPTTDAPNGAPTTSDAVVMASRYTSVVLVLSLLGMLI